MQTFDAKLCIAPISQDVVEAVYKYSSLYRVPLALIASKNQIDWDGGYVHNWLTKEFTYITNCYKHQYPNSRVFICRDHCGPGFKETDDELEDVYKTIDIDIECGFDYIHVDFSNFKKQQQDVIWYTNDCIDYIKNKNENILIEVGTEEIGGLSNIKNIEKDLSQFQTWKNKIDFYVINTGSLVKEGRQVGVFNQDHTRKISEYIHEWHDIKIKEHNADFLSFDELNKRKDLIDAVNIAPQLGTVQTQTVLHEATIYGINTDRFTDLVLRGLKWEKWQKSSAPISPWGAALIAGHYHFNSCEYDNIMSELSNECDIYELIQANIFDVITHYLRGLNG